MTPTFRATLPFPTRRSAEVLKRQLIDHLIAVAPRVGERFASDHELVSATGLSRPTVRRALNSMAQEGWIERRHGRGTYVGPRVTMPISLETRPPHDTSRRRPIVRVAVVIHLLGDLQHDWYSRGVIAGIDEAAGELDVAVELLGDQDGDVKAVSRRLMLTRPDVLAFAAPSPMHLQLLGECQRLDIAAIGTGTFLASLAVTTVHEDGVQGAAAAVKELVALGHRRIGMVLSPYATPWVFDRRQGYVQGIREAGLEHDEGLVLWLGGDDKEKSDALEQFIARRRPTALLFGSYGVVRHLRPLIRSGLVRVPRDLSVVHFDQCADTKIWLEDVKPTVVEIPVRGMGRQLALLAREIADGKEVAKVTKLPCELRWGESTMAVPNGVSPSVSEAVSKLL